MKKILLSAVALAGALTGHVFAQGLATGFAISENHVLTAYDVVDNKRSVQLKFGNGNWMRADYIDGNPDEGWCVLRLQEKAPSSVIIEDREEAKSGDDIYAFCAENDEAARGDIDLCDGCIVGVEKDLRHGTIIRHTAKLGKGAIGAGLFSEEDHHAIGLIIENYERSSRMPQKAISLYANAARIRQHTGKENTATRRTNRDAVCVIMSDAVETTGNRRRATRSYTASDTNTATYQKSRDSMATIDTADSAFGRGTGFVCEMDGKQYFITNKHVAYQKQPAVLVAHFIDGEKIEFDLSSKVEIAENRDLVRFEIQTKRPCLQLSDSTPNIGARSNSMAMREVVKS